MNILEIQEKFIQAGFQWKENIYNDSLPNCSLIVTRDVSPHALDKYPRPADCVGWGRFERLHAWQQAYEWLQTQEKEMNPLETGKLVPISDCDNDGKVIAAGPLSHQPGTMPYRIVLVAYKDGKYSVHTELFNKDRSELCSGQYFKSGPTGLTDATMRFAYKIQNHAPMVETIFN